MLFYWCCGAMMALFGFFFLFGFGCFRNANHRRKSYPADRHEHGGGATIPDEGMRVLQESRAWWDSRPFETVSVCACDGVRLVGKALSADGDARGIVLCFHGYHSSCRRDLSIQAQRLHEAGYHLILVSQRAHGESEGKYICFGAKERYDVAPWCALAQNRFGALPIALLGLSMGATTVLLASALPLPDAVSCVIADCGFSSPWEIIWRTLRRKHQILPFPVIYFMNYWSRMLAGFDYRECSTVDAVKEKSLPVLLIHGEEDRYVPCEMSRRIADANDTELWVVPNARHAQAVYYAPEEYAERMLSFLKRNIQNTR